MQECAKLLQVSESTLYATLAQLDKKNIQEASKKVKQTQKTFEVVKNNPEEDKVDPQYILEKKIIELLLLYGDRTEFFEDVILKEDDKGELVYEPEQKEVKVYEKVYLDLQQDEIELTNQKFKFIYNHLIQALSQEQDFKVQTFINDLEQDLSNEVSNILMEEERYELHKWNQKEIYPKAKTDSVAQLVSETILSLRSLLIQGLLHQLQGQTKEASDTSPEILEEVMGYLQLRKLLHQKLNRVVS